MHCRICYCLGGGCLQVLDERLRAMENTVGAVPALFVAIYVLMAVVLVLAGIMIVCGVRRWWRLCQVLRLPTQSLDIVWRPSMDRTNPFL